MKIQATIRFLFESEGTATIFLQSFSPEIDQMPMKRTAWSFEKQKSEIIFEIHSEDAIAFRATLNSLLQFAYAVEKTVQITTEL
jgi:tRNA threonylcarbamoyladenosine modification (KEOPS) complex  Pcc1 subunit